MSQQYLVRFYCVHAVSLPVTKDAQHHETELTQLCYCHCLCALSHRAQRHGCFQTVVVHDQDVIEQQWLLHLRVDHLPDLFLLLEEEVHWWRELMIASTGV